MIDFNCIQFLNLKFYVKPCPKRYYKEYKFKLNKYNLQNTNK